MESTTKLVEEFKTRIGTINATDLKALEIGTEPSKEYFYRRNSYEEMGKLILYFLHHGLINHLFVTGLKGSGKTTTTKMLLQEIKDSEEYNFEYHYINCRGMKRSYDVITKHLLKGAIKKGQDPIQEAQQFFEEKNKKIILVLDEVENLQDDDLLYHMSRNESFKNTQLILITRKPKYLEKISEDVLSSLSLNFFHFDNYNKEEMNTILELRAKKGLKNHNSYLLSKISELTVREARSDVRVGIKVLKTIFLESSHLEDSDMEITKIGLHLQEIIQQEYYALKESLINKLSTEKLLVLYSATKAKLGQESLKLFNRLSPSKISYRQFLRIIDDLEKLDLLSIRKLRLSRSWSLDFVPNIGEKNLALVVNLLNSTPGSTNEKISVF